MAKAIMGVAEGTALLSATVHRIDHDAKMTLPAANAQRYIAVLSGQILCMIGDECPPFNVGEVWWLADQEALLINKSGDDAIILNVVVKIDE